MLRGLLWAFVAAVIVFVPLAIYAGWSAADGGPGVPRDVGYAVGQSFGIAWGPLASTVGYGIGYRGRLSGRLLGIGAFLLLWFVAALGYFAFRDLGPLPRGPVWQPDPALSSKLVSSSTVGAFKLCIPAGYTRVTPPQQPNAETRAWGLSLPDGTVCLLAVADDDLSAQRGGLNARAGILDGVVDSLRRQFTDFQCSERQEGQINGLAMLRLTWQGTGAGERERGVSMAGIHSGHIVAVMAMCPAAAAHTQLPLLETSARTISAVE